MKTLSQSSLWSRLVLFVFLSLLHFQRALAIDILVTTNSDSGNGTLRQAIQFNESLGGGNTIVFSNIVTGTITLTNVLGELLITKDVTITGPGAKVLAISGNNAHRVLHLTTSATVSISGLKITAGTFPVVANGAGILQDSGVLVLSNCLISGNSTIFNASAGGSGGGIFANGTLTVIGCTVSGNYAYENGGGIRTGTAATLINCTIAGNADGAGSIGGGGIFQTGGTLAITNCTISNNGHSSGSLGGGGICKSNGTATVRNTVIAGNVSGSTGPDCYGAFTSAGFNLIGKIDGSTGWGALGDQIGTVASPINALLGPLQDNGASTPTMAPLLFSSPAIDQGNKSGILTDQRGRSRPYTNSYVSSIPLGGDYSDIGAFEFSPGTLVVINTNNSGSGSLRQTILDAALSDTITFASNVVGTIVLTGGELGVSNSVNILGPGAKVLAVSGNNSNRVFHIVSGQVLLADLTITKGTNNGSLNNSGGGILNEAAGNLTVSNCVVSLNSVFNMGAGIANRGILKVLNSAIVSNTAFGAGLGQGAKGGGIYNTSSGSIENSTISGNTATGGVGVSGGGIYNYSSDAFGLIAYYSTVTSNTANSGIGGGIYDGGGTYSVDIENSIVANNTGGSSPDLFGTFPYGSFSLIGKVDGSSGLTNGVNHNQAGSSAVPLDPKLGPLRDNGGPTPTHALLLGSPAIDHAIGFYGTYTDQHDQRGAPRPVDIVSATNGISSDGSDIGAFELGSPQLNIQRLTSSIVLAWPAYYGGFTLESVTNLPASNNWSAVSGTPVVVGVQFNVTNGPTSGNKFFRLRGY